MVVYGGSLVDANSTLQGDVYILDVTSLTWTKAPPPPSNSQFRRNMACTAAGNNFVVWGGISSLSLSLPLFFCSYDILCYYYLPTRILLFLGMNRTIV